MSVNAEVPVIFLIGAQRSGTTMLERILTTHPDLTGGAEPHIMTPLAHVGVWGNVNAASYDHIIAGIGQKHFVESLPGGYSDYWKACRAYCDYLYCAARGSKSKWFLDKTPEYCTVLPFIEKVYPDAKYILIGRHPAAIFSSFANSFFDGNYQLAYNHDPLLKRYLPVLAHFLRTSSAAIHYLRYEDLVTNPHAEVEKMCRFIGIDFHEDMISYGKSRDERKEQGLGDPETVKKHDRPMDTSVNKWAAEMVASAEKRAFMNRILDELADEDLRTLGYPRSDLWAAHDSVESQVTTASSKLTRYRLERKLIVYGRWLVQRTSLLTQVLKRVRLTCDVLLREY